MKTLKDLNIDNKKVIIRCDLNVPIEDNKITDNTRIVKSLKTINYALNKNAKVIFKEIILLITKIDIIILLFNYKFH